MEQAVRAGPRQWLALAVLVLPILVVTIDGSVLVLALPRLSVALGATSVEQLWIVDIYLFMIAGFVVVLGGIADRFGHRRVLLLSAATFCAGSLLAAYSANAPMLIGARVITGIAGAAILPTTLTLINVIFPDARRRAVGVSLRTSTALVGTAVGPVVGGVLLEWFWWGSVFLLGLPVVATLLIAGPFVLPEQRRGVAARVDLPSVVLFLPAVLATVYGLKQFARYGPGLVSVAAVVGGVVVGIGFSVRQHRRANPLLDLRLFRSRAFGAMSGGILVGNLVLGGVALFVPVYLQSVVGLPPLGAGLYLMPQALATALSTLALPHLARRFRLSWLVSHGFVIAAVGCVVIALAAGPTTVVLGSALASIGVLWISVLGIIFLLSSAPIDRAGAISSVLITTNQLGAALGLGVLGSVGISVYHADLVVPGGLPSAMASAAGESVSAAVAVARQLPSGPAAELVTSAQTSFVTGLNVVGGVGAVLLIGLGILVSSALGKKSERHELAAQPVVLHRHDAP